MEIKGLDEAIDRIEQLQQDAEELNGLHQVSFSELFTPTFRSFYKELHADRETGC